VQERSERMNKETRERSEHIELTSEHLYLLFIHSRLAPLPCTRALTKESALPLHRFASLAPLSLCSHRPRLCSHVCVVPAARFASLAPLSTAPSLCSRMCVPHTHARFARRYDHHDQRYNRPSLPPPLPPRPPPTRSSAAPSAARFPPPTKMRFTATRVRGATALGASQRITR